MRRISIVVSLLLFALLLKGQDHIALLSTSAAVIADVSLSSEYATTPFELAGGKILLTMKLNGKEGKYLLDTGADALIINGIPSETSNYEAQGLSSNGAAELIQVNDLEVGNLNFKQFEAYKVDLSSIESQTGVKIDGIIGNDLIGRAALHIDYQNQLLTFLPSPKRRQMKKQGWQAFHLLQIGHLYALRMDINNKIMTMGLDTGAEINLLLKSTKIAVLASQQLTVLGVQSGQQSAQKVKLQSAILGKSKVNIGGLYYSPTPQVEEQFQGELSGLLGFPFFANNSIILDFENGLLYLK